MGYEGVGGAFRESLGRGKGKLRNKATAESIQRHGGWNVQKIPERKGRRKGCSAKYPEKTNRVRGKKNWELAKRGGGGW